ncbi:MAG: sensor histidine kinase [Actinobacteria bacterium]|nr:sensor histidine kinase [Actinomycetota bacterium]
MKISQYFRTSLFRKVFSVSSIISIAVIYFLGSNLYNRISDGIIEEKISAAISEGEAAIQYADYRFLIASLNRNSDYKTIVDEIVKSTSVSAKSSGREIALLSSTGKRIAGIPSRSTSNFLEPASIPSELRQLVTQDDEIHWQRTNLQYFQQRFVSDVSHELRTPLTTIRMASDLIYAARERFDPTIARSAELLLSQIDRFEELLTDLLEVSRFDAQVATLSLSRIDLVKLVNRCVEDLAMDAKQREVQIRIDAPNEELFIDGDSRRIERIMRNLLGNAIDHAEGKPVDLTIKAGQSAVSISVKDYGVGIATNHLERVFDRFWRADPSRSRIRGGTGLGLSIAREDANLHGGDIKLWSELGAGAQFVLTLPLTQDQLINREVQTHFDSKCISLEKQVRLELRIFLLFYHQQTSLSHYFQSL